MHACSSLPPAISAPFAHLHLDIQGVIINLYMARTVLPLDTESSGHLAIARDLFLLLMDGPLVLLPARPSLREAVVR